MKKPFRLLVSLVSLFSLASCGNNSAKPSSKPSGNDSTNAGSNYDNISGAGAKEIQFWHCIGHDKMRNLQRIIDKFNEDHANTDGYYVKAYQIAGAYDDLHDAVKTKLQAGFVPSITMGYPDSFAEYIGSAGEAKSKILNLDSFISNDSSFKASDFVEEYYKEGSGYQYSGTWSLPLYKSTEVMYYNKTAYEASQFYQNHKDETYGQYGAKIADPSTWDWDTLVYVAGEIQKENKNTSDFHALGYDSDSNLFISQMAQRGIPYTTAQEIGNTSDEKRVNHFQFASIENGNLKANENLVSFATDIYNLTQAGTLVTQGSYGSYASDLFKKKKVMFTVGSTGGSAYNEPNGSFVCGLSKVPAYQNNQKYIMQGPSICFFNTKDSAKEKATWDFYSKYVSDANLNAQLALENSYDPIKKASYETDSYTNWIENGKDGSGKEDVTAELQYRIPSLTASLKDSYMTSPVFIGSSKARTEIGKIISYTKEKKGNVTEAIKTIFNNCALAS